MPQACFFYCFRSLFQYSYKCLFFKDSAMTQQVRKGVIAVAGQGTRFLPATKSMPKEMLPIIDTPIVQYIVEEMGWVVAPRDVAALKAAILAYVQLAQAEKYSLKQQTRLRVEQNFSIETVGHQYMQVWSQQA